jgi:hypothetical protein
MLKSLQTAINAELKARTRAKLGTQKMPKLKAKAKSDPISPAAPQA